MQSPQIVPYTFLLLCCFRFKKLAFFPLVSNEFGLALYIFERRCSRYGSSLSVYAMNVLFALHSSLGHIFGGQYSTLDAILETKSLNNLCVAALFDSKDTGKSQALRMLTNHTSSSYPTCRQLFRCVVVWCKNRLYTFSMQALYHFQKDRKIASLSKRLLF